MNRRGFFATLFAPFLRRFWPQPEHEPQSKWLKIDLGNLPYFEFPSPILSMQPFQGHLFVLTRDGIYEFVPRSFDGVPEIRLVSRHLARYV